MGNEHYSLIRLGRYQQSSKRILQMKQQLQDRFSHRMIWFVVAMALGRLVIIPNTLSQQFKVLFV